MRKVYERQNTTIYQFNVHYGAKVSIERDEDIVSHSIVLIEMNRSTHTKKNWYTVISNPADAPMGGDEVAEILVHLDTLVNTRRLREALEKVNKNQFNYFELLELNDKERVEYKKVHA